MPYFSTNFMEKLENKKSKTSKTKRVLHAVTNYLAIIWAICVVGVVTILAVASKFMTKDPDFSPGDAENVYLLPMLSLFFLGLGAFGLMIVSGIASIIIKGEKSDFKPPFSLSIKRVFLVVGVLFIGVFASLFAFRQAGAGTYQPDSVATIPTFTGQELFDAVNVYRNEKGVKELKLDPNLCANLAQRYFDIKKGLDEGIAHKNFDEWVEKYIEPLGGYYVGEDFAWGSTPQEVIKIWEGSPGHRLSILDPNNTLGCTYAAEGYAVIILGYRQNYTTQRTISQNETPSRTGKIISYHEWCTNKDISIYENELITKKSSDGNIYTMTQGDWDCYENYIKK